MSLNGKKVCDFSVKAYQNGEFIDVTQENLKGQWLHLRMPDGTGGSAGQVRGIQEDRLRDLLRILRHPFRTQSMA